MVQDWNAFTGELSGGLRKLRAEDPDLGGLDYDMNVFMNQWGSEIDPEAFIFKATAAAHEKIIGKPAAVTAVPDEMRGERIIAFHTDASLDQHALWDRLCESELPRLWVPKREDIHHVDALPILGTGKVDLRTLRQIAQQMAGQAN